MKRIEVVVEKIGEPNDAGLGSRRADDGSGNSSSGGDGGSRPRNVTVISMKPSPFCPCRLGIGTFLIGRRCAPKAIKR